MYESGETRNEYKISAASSRDKESFGVKWVLTDVAYEMVWIQMTWAWVRVVILKKLRNVGNRVT
jgi:hypothetical protein